MEIPIVEPNFIEKLSVRYKHFQVFSIILKAHGCGVIDHIFALGAESFSQKRLRSFMDSVESELYRLDEQKIDPQFFTTEDFWDLFLFAERSAQYTHNRQKHEMLARVLVGSARVDRGTEDSQVMLRTVAELEPREIQAAQIIFEAQRELCPTYDQKSELEWAANSWATVMAKLDDWVGEDQTYVLLRLERAGLIKEITGGYMNYVGGVYTVTPTFRRLMAELKSSNS